MREVVAFAVESLDVEVLHVGVEGGKSPGDVLVVSGDDKGHTGERDPGGVKPWCAQIGHVPDVGLGEGQVHVVGEQGLAAGSVAPGDDPVVGAGGATGARERAEQGAEG